MKTDINGIIYNGKVYEATTLNDPKPSCIKCDMIDEFGDCEFHEFCIACGRNNIFRHSESLTEKLNKE